MKSADIGLIGLAVMGENIVLNLERHGYKVAVYNRTSEKVDAFIRERACGKNIIGFDSIRHLVASLNRPRKIMIMIKAGIPVDNIIEQLIPYLEKGDIIIDGGNSHYSDSIRRTYYLEKKGFFFVGAGVSGGEVGALNGPSIMPGGSEPAWQHIKSIFFDIAAKVEMNQPCCAWIGRNGAGHFVKMVHNGIEYGDMQLICEAYFIMKELLCLSADEMRDVFEEWNNGELDSYLIEITRDIFGFVDIDGELLVDKILDVAGQKGTGAWTGIASLELGVPLTLIAESVFARYLSAMKNQRVRYSKILKGPTPSAFEDKKTFIADLTNALYASKIVSYAQGFALLREAAAVFSWNLDYSSIALIWRGGCIIRSAFLGQIADAFNENSNLENLLTHPFFQENIQKCQIGWRNVVTMAIRNGISVPCMSSALCYYDGLRSANLPANLLQAQRDYFGAHTYERLDKPRGEFFHTNWSRNNV
ncbi:decarboxylating NADP(+)-dependent phosphogluconate dehydrogenase [Candidatus Parcubacteria bacterium]|nr:MAG: decarboxylating NADP(+)-dependent phosphogluconate dehydrogenase [Candidatus Parcubacteria bacterium]